MKNNTKLIMETWRRFLNEGTEGIDEYGMVEEMTDEDNPSELPPVRDSDLEDKFADFESPYFDEEEESYDPAQAYGKDAYQDKALEDDLKMMDSMNKDKEMDMYGDPAQMGRESSAPMLDAPDDGELDDDTSGPAYESDPGTDDPVTFSGSYDDSMIDF